MVLVTLPVKYYAPLSIDLQVLCQSDLSPWIYLSSLLYSTRVSHTVRLCETPWTITYQVPLSMEFSRQEYWSEFTTQLLSRVQLFATPWTAAYQESLFSPSPRAYSNSCPLKQWFYPTTSSSTILFSSYLLPFQHQDFSNESALLMMWPKYWSFSISPSNEYSRLISFRIDWFDLIAVQGTLKSLLQYWSLKASILQHSAFFMVKFTHPYMNTEKTIGWTIRLFVSKVMSLLFNMQSRFVIAFFQGASVF